MQEMRDEHELEVQELEEEFEVNRGVFFFFNRGRRRDTLWCVDILCGLIHLSYVDVVLCFCSPFDLSPVRNKTRFSICSRVTSQALPSVVLCAEGVFFQLRCLAFA